MVVFCRRRYQPLIRSIRFTGNRLTIAPLFHSIDDNPLGYGVNVSIQEILTHPNRQTRNSPDADSYFAVKTLDLGIHQRSYHMRHKFRIKRSERKKELRIREYANLEREPKNEWQRPGAESFSLIGEETYGKGIVTTAIKKGNRHLISVLRTHNMYPIGIYAEEIAASVKRLYESETSRSVELSFDDKAYFESVDNLPKPSSVR